MNPAERLSAVGHGSWTALDVPSARLRVWSASHGGAAEHRRGDPSVTTPSPIRIVRVIPSMNIGGPAIHA